MDLLLLTISVNSLIKSLWNILNYKMQQGYEISKLFDVKKNMILSSVFFFDDPSSVMFLS